MRDGWGRCAALPIVDFADRLPPEVLEGYFTRRSDWYEQRNGLPREFGARDTFDDVSYIVLAAEGTRCLGGARATVSSPDAPRLLPMETLCPGLQLGDLFPDLPLATTAHAEFSRLVVDGSLGLGNDLALRLFTFLLRNNPRPDVRYCFSITATARNRMYRALARANRLEHHARTVPEALIPPVLRPFGPQTVQVYHLEGIANDG